MQDLPRPGTESVSPALTDRWILYHWATNEAVWVICMITEGIALHCPRCQLQEIGALLTASSLCRPDPTPMSLQPFILVWQSAESKSLSRVRLFVTPWTIQSMGFSRPEYWSGLPFPSPGDLPHPGTKPMSPTLQADYLPAEPQSKFDRVLRFHQIKIASSIQKRLILRRKRHYPIIRSHQFSET